MRKIFVLISLASFSSAYAMIIPYNLCADKTKTDCEALHMPSLGLIDNLIGHETASCGDGCVGHAAAKAIRAVSRIAPNAGDIHPYHYITFETNPNNFVYTQPDQDQKDYFERIIVEEENDLLTIKYCPFFTNNINATLEKYKKDKLSENVQAGNAIIGNKTYNKLKTAFQAQVDFSYCKDLD